MNKKAVNLFATTLGYGTAGGLVGVGAGIVSASTFGKNQEEYEKLAHNSQKANLVGGLIGGLGVGMYKNGANKKVSLALAGAGLLSSFGAVGRDNTNAAMIGLGALGAAASFTRPVNKFLTKGVYKSNKIQSHYTKVFSDAYYRMTT